MSGFRGWDTQEERSYRLPGMWVSYAVAPRGIGYLNNGFILTAYRYLSNILHKAYTFLLFFGYSRNVIIHIYSNVLYFSLTYLIKLCFKCCVVGCVYLHKPNFLCSYFLQYLTIISLLQWPYSLIYPILFMIWINKLTSKSLKWMNKYREEKLQQYVLPLSVNSAVEVKARNSPHPSWASWLGHFLFPEEEQQQEAGGSSVAHLEWTGSTPPTERHAHNI